MVIFMVQYNSAYGDIKTFEFGQSASQREFHVNNMHSAAIHSMCNIIAW